MRTGREIATLDELGKLLGMPHPPSYIEAYDISNMGSDSIVGAMVVFENGAPLKSAYKKFSIKTTNGQDDYAAMHEMLSRRFQRYFEDKDSGEGFGRLPDLILLFSIVRQAAAVSDTNVWQPVGQTKNYSSVTNWNSPSTSSRIDAVLSGLWLSAEYEIVPVTPLKSDVASIASLIAAVSVGSSTVASA